MTNREIEIIQATVELTLAALRRPVKPRAQGPSRVGRLAVAPPELVAWLAGRERVTLAEAMPVLGMPPGKRGASLAGHMVSAAGWRRVGRTNGPAGQVWYYERR